MKNSSDARSDFTTSLALMTLSALTLVLWSSHFLTSLAVMKPKEDGRHHEVGQVKDSSRADDE